MRWQWIGARAGVVRGGVAFSNSRSFRTPHLTFPDSFALGAVPASCAAHAQVDATTSGWNSFPIVNDPIAAFDVEIELKRCREEFFHIGHGAYAAKRPFCASAVLKLIDRVALPAWGEPRFLSWAPDARLRRLRMEKHIVRWSYLLGLVCVFVAAVWRLAGAFGMSHQFCFGGSLVGYWSFFRAAFLFLLLTVASASYAAAMKE